MTKEDIKIYVNELGDPKYCILDNLDEDTYQKLISTDYKLWQTWPPAAQDPVIVNVYCNPCETKLPRSYYCVAKPKPSLLHNVVQFFLKDNTEILLADKAYSVPAVCKWIFKHFRGKKKCQLSNQMVKIKIKWKANL